VSRDPEMMADMIDAPVVGRAIMATPGVPVNTAVFA
jgi:hypothetical protein